MNAEESSAPISAELLDWLACPLDYSAVHLDGTELVCTKCGRRFSIENGTPNMLVEEDD
ncbi:MAG: Trm112 family protein [Thermomicrobiales bacterium]